jgi:hypothetical protein
MKLIENKQEPEEGVPSNWFERFLCYCFIALMTNIVVEILKSEEKKQQRHLRIAKGAE